jgi:hypothetical protein
MSTTLSHVRHDKGVVIRWELHMRNNIFIVERFRKYFKCATCAASTCEHKKLAEQLEENWQLSKSGEKPGSCFFCGRLARDRNGLAICATCAL